MTHVFVVDSSTFKYHLEYGFAGTGAKDKPSPFLANSDCNYHSTTERMLVGMIADINRIRIGDKVVFYLQASGGNQGVFFGTFKVASLPFFDENDASNYLSVNTGKGLSFRVLIEPDKVYPLGVTEHEYLDSLVGKSKPYDLCWSLIYRKLKGNRGCTMIFDYEFDDLIDHLDDKNNRKYLNGPAFSYNSKNSKIIEITNSSNYAGRKDQLNILPRLLYKASHKNAYETHLQAYITQNCDKDELANLLLSLNGNNLWIGNEVSCGVGMQRIDVLLVESNETDVYINVIELKCVPAYQEIVISQIPWYLTWLSQYVTPRFSNKKVHVIPTVIAEGKLPAKLNSLYSSFTFNIKDADVEKLRYIGVSFDNSQIKFTKYL